MKKKTKAKNVAESYIRYTALIQEMVRSGFTQEQAQYLVKLLAQYLPIV